jgi:RHS repeat-associated protein
VLSDGDIYWSASQFGISQEVYVKLYTIDSSASRIGVLLKSQSSSGWGSGVLEVFYHPGSSTVQVWTYESSQGWVQHGASLSISFANGNILGVRAYASGTVEVYKNAILVGVRDVSSWPYYDDGGYIGIRTVGGPSTYYDDFGGGSLPVAYQPQTGGKVLAAYMPPLIRVREKARPHLARVYKAVMLLTRPAGVIWRSYYYSGSTRIAMREDSDQGSEVYYLLTDHLGSTSVAFTFDEYDQVDFISRQWYTPWGETRPGSSVTATDYGFTGQLEDKAIGLYWYRSRWYDQSLGRWSQPDSVVPLASQGVQAWNRFTYVNNSPTRHIDPSGHIVACDHDDWACQTHWDKPVIPNTNKRGSENEDISPTLTVSPTILGTNGWDYVPVVSDVRKIIRGSQMAYWTADQPGFMDEQISYQTWINNCYGVCHGARPEPFSPLGGPMPDVPLVDMYSQGMGEAANGVINIIVSIGYAKNTTNIWVEGGTEWHVGWQTNNEMSIIHVGNSANVEFGGIHLAIGSYAPRKAFFHIYFYPNPHIWFPGMK